MSRTTKPDVIIRGAGIIGLSLALELSARGAQVVVLESTSAYSQSSSAAAGMLAAHDPHNPPQLSPLANLSEALYPSFLSHLEAAYGLPVPFQTHLTHQHASNGSTTELTEKSIDPRMLGQALRTAVQARTIDLREHTPHDPLPPGIPTIHTTGAWHSLASPTKGQMLRVELPPDLPLREVHRAEHIYIVPRTTGPQAGSALIGATVEQAGFDLSANPDDIAALHARATKLLPQLAHSRTIEAWAGLRPDTPDHLPILGELRPNNHGPREFIATGHFRNGILLAPATAVVLADLLEGKTPSVDIAAFSPQRFVAATH